MDKVEGLLKNLNLSELERKSLKIGWSDGGKLGAVEPQAIAKLLSDKPAHREALETALGRLWCPMKRLICKNMGENTFLFTFHQASGRKKAVDEGPWMFNKSLLVVEEFDPRRSLGEYEFNSIPIWIRIFNLPLGMMNRDTCEEIGNEVGKYMEADVEENGTAMGRYLRVKVRINITKPLRRGIKLDVGEGRTDMWCRFEYEFLPDFCYRCGMLDHIDRECTIKLKKGEIQQFGSWMKAHIPRYGGDQQRGIGEADRSLSDGRVSGNSRSYGFGARNGRSGSDSDSWRKGDQTTTKVINNSEEKDSEATSPLKTINDANHADGQTLGAKKQLFQAELDKVNKQLDVGSAAQHLAVVHGGGPSKDPELVEASGAKPAANHVDQHQEHTVDTQAAQVGEGVLSLTGKEHLRKFKRRVKEGKQGVADGSKFQGSPMKEKKRAHEEVSDDMDIDSNKKRKVSEDSNIDAELQGQLCGSQ
uniref:Uncharacterized protein n=1 Tax=Avena sativa TaxID=4498 RepID=A0ACD5ZFZ3_AVESA